ncbi:MAG: DUF86 domain-containing protein [bacterium]|nr:DUF86 domain-containing protein [bacterium]
MNLSDYQRINKIYEHASRLHKYVIDNNISREAILTDYTLQWLVTTPLYNMGEQAYNLSSEYKSEHNEIPWRKISGLRHLLIHDYDGTNWNMIVEVVFDELPVLITQLEGLLVIQGENFTDPAHKRAGAGDIGGEF